MAFVDLDEDGDKFANLTQAVGPGKANVRDDVTLVQLLLISHFHTGYKKQGRPQRTSAKPELITLGTFDTNTGTMIKDFQRLFLGRAKPQGYVQTAGGKKKSNSTIWHLNRQMELTLILALDPRNALDYLRAFPDLAPGLREVTVPTVEIQ